MKGCEYIATYFKRSRVATLFTICTLTNGLHMLIGTQILSVNKYQHWILFLLLQFWLLEKEAC